MRTKISSELLEKYLRNECSSEELKLLLDWYASFEDDLDPVDMLPQIQQKELKERMLQHIRSNLKYKQFASEKKPDTAKRNLYYSLAALAAAIIVVFSIVHYFLPKSGSSKSEIVLSADKTSFSNESGKLKHCTLPDGSDVWLKPKAKISYTHVPQSKFREVNLTGECFFDVKRDVLHPFIIRTGELRTKVLGTSFNVKAYNSMRSAEVSVVTGKVYVYISKNGFSERKGIILLPAQKAVYTQGHKDIIQVKEDSPDLRIWEKRNIFFENKPIPQVVKALNAKFNVNIEVIDPEINDYTLKADFTGQNLPEILEMISKSLDVNYEITEERIFIKSNED
ncbi:FecR family protein [Arcticibacter tournemirensis]|uniref:DUF4974 domain-containing protein n=1 Tax=Arcticibacter tournemirensis TaxID=699437 RepID=A0A5M9HI19_9SPHI|nr:FecR domain-containing protein [Arcticibacter tournemirensis]KAA8486666.1 DUF4974 domain-containing protein [Arcticibacter tournemirensis]TQM49196.1 FecR family protein [Arcticibacter tournemirensis]